MPDMLCLVLDRAHTWVNLAVGLDGIEGHGDEGVQAAPACSGNQNSDLGLFLGLLDGFVDDGETHFV